MTKKVKGPALRVLTWTPSRYAKWRECPAKVKYEDLMKMCPVCFRGRVSGGYDGEPQVCDTCDEPQPERPALDRGNRLDAAISHAVAGPSPAGRMEAQAHGKLAALVEGRGEEADDDHGEATRHPAIAALAVRLRKAKGVTVQDSIVFDSGWQRVSQFTKNAWARLKLDVWRLARGVADIIDWKSGNIDKSKGVIRPRAEYADSMRMYQVGVLSAYPAVREAEVRMAFIDAPPKESDPFRSLPVLRRADLPAAQAEVVAKVAPMLADTVFPPRPGLYCQWCHFSKGKGGPCPF